MNKKNIDDGIIFFLVAIMFAVGCAGTVGIVYDVIVSDTTFKEVALELTAFITAAIIGRLFIQVYYK